MIQTINILLENKWKTSSIDWTVKMWNLMTFLLVAAPHNKSYFNIYFRSWFTKWPSKCDASDLKCSAVSRWQNKTQRTSHWIEFRRKSKNEKNDTKNQYNFGMHLLCADLAVSWKKKKLKQTNSRLKETLNCSINFDFFFLKFNVQSYLIIA